MCGVGGGAGTHEKNQPGALPCHEALPGRVLDNLDSLGACGGGERMTRKEEEKDVPVLLAGETHKWGRELSLQGASNSSAGDPNRKAMDWQTGSLSWFC